MLVPQVEYVNNLSRHRIDTFHDHVVVSSVQSIFALPIRQIEVHDVEQSRSHFALKRFFAQFTLK